MIKTLINEIVSLLDTQREGQINELEREKVSTAFGVTRNSLLVECRTAQQTLIVTVEGMANWMLGKCVMHGSIPLSPGLASLASLLKDYLPAKRRGGEILVMNHVTNSLVARCDLQECAPNDICYDESAKAMWVVGTHLLKFRCRGGTRLLCNKLSTLGALRVCCFEGQAIVRDYEEQGRCSVFNSNGDLLHRWSSESLGLSLGMEIEAFPTMVVIAGPTSVWDAGTSSPVRQLLPLEDLGKQGREEPFKRPFFRPLEGLHGSTGGVGYNAPSSMFLVAREQRVTLQCIHGTVHGSYELPEDGSCLWMLCMPAVPLRPPLPPAISNKQQVDRRWVNKDHGFAVKEYRSGASYQGNWWYGVRHGMGDSEGDDGSYSGEWRSGQRCGHGKLVRGDGSWYCGQWRDDLQDDRTGMACELCSDGSSYKGCFARGKRHYHGRHEVRDVSCYEGEWKDGKHHGYGVLAWADGEVYKGNFDDGLVQGRGTMHRTGRAPYTGIFKAGSYIKRLAADTPVTQQPVRGQLLPISHPDAEAFRYELFCRLDCNGQGEVRRDDVVGFIEANPAIVSELRLPEELTSSAGPWTEIVASIHEAIKKHEPETLRWDEMRLYFQGKTPPPREPPPREEYLAGWEDHVDPQGRTFWYHKESMRRQWAKPPAPPKADPGKPADMPETISIDWARELFFRLDREGSGQISRDGFAAWLRDETGCDQLPSVFHRGGAPHAHCEAALAVVDSLAASTLGWPEFVGLWGL